MMKSFFFNLTWLKLLLYDGFILTNVRLYWVTMDFESTGMLVFSPLEKDLWLPFLATTNRLENWLPMSQFELYIYVENNK